MEAKVKALKALDLRNALMKAGVSLPAKVNKPELITKVLATPDALVALGLSEPPSKTVTEDGDDLLAPPAEFDWDGETAEPSSDAAPTAAPAKPAAAAKPASKAAPAPAATPAPASTTTTAPSTKATPAVAATPANNPPVPAATTTDKLDEEEEKRKRRAERFGMTYTPSVPATPTPAVPKHAHHPRGSNAAKTPKAATTAASIDDPEKLKARAARFNTKPATATPASNGTPPTSATSTPTTAGKKRPAAEPVDPEEEERRRKRAERFAQPVATK